MLSGFSNKGDVLVPESSPWGILASGAGRLRRQSSRAWSVCLSLSPPAPPCFPGLFYIGFILRPMWYKVSPHPQPLFSARHRGVP